MQLQLHYITQHYATLRKLHYTTNTTATALLYTRLHYTIHSTVRNTTVPYANYTPPQLQLQLQLHYANYITQQLQMHYAKTTTITALHSSTSSSCGEVITATIVTTPKNTTPTTLRSISGFALPSMHHNNKPLL